MECVEAKVRNTKKPLFDGTYQDIVYYSAFGDTKYADDKVFYYDEEIQHHKEAEVNKAYIDELKWM